MIENIDEGGSMAILKCPECGGNVSDTADRCPHCGNDMQPEQTAAKGCSDAMEGCGCSMMLLPIIVVLLFIAVALIVGFFQQIF